MRFINYVTVADVHIGVVSVSIVVTIVVVSVPVEPGTLLLTGQQLYEARKRTAGSL